jgi:hypothetical protein
MLTISFPELHAAVDRYHAEHNSPSAVAVRAVETLRDALLDCSARERGEILDLLKAELYELPVTA